MSKLVEFELDDFDMTPYCLNPDIACEGQKPVYDLVGVVNHMGSMSFGHYTARVRHPEHPNVWRTADDSNVSDCKKDRVCTEHVYLLFYKLREDESCCQKTDVNNLAGTLRKMSVEKEDLDSDDLEEPQESESNV